ncbi:DUF4893 domain-containing protein [Sphingomonas sp. CJ99]
MRHPILSALIPPALALSALTGCTSRDRLQVPESVSAVVPAGAEQGMVWRAIATPDDRTRLRKWRATWMEVLDSVRPAAASALAAEGALFDPDLAVEMPLPPSGQYRCRWFKLGTQGRATDPFSQLPAQQCTLWRDGDHGGIRFEDGAQRPIAMLLPENSARAMVLGSLMLADETVPHAYGRDPLRDLAGYIERIGEARWRIVLPRPRFESQLDIIEIAPVG